MRVGLVSYGAYLPSQVVLATDIKSKVPPLGVKQKTVPADDEDTATISVAAAQQALGRLPKSEKKSEIGCLWVGSESHPYAVKPTGTIVAQALGLATQLATADLQFACKAGTQGLQIAAMYVKAGQVALGMAIGADTAQARHGDALEFTAAAGGAAFVVGSKHLIAELIDTCSVATDTPDFWRRPGQPYPEHAGRFTGEPAYFTHVSQATKDLLKRQNLKISGITHCVFHTPNGKFPQAVAKSLGCKPEQLIAGLVVSQVGNTYAGATMLGLVSVLDQAKAGDTILMCSYGSGSGSDCFLWKCTEELEKRRKKWKHFLAESIARLQPISATDYRQRRRHV